MNGGIDIREDKAKYFADSLALCTKLKNLKKLDKAGREATYNYDFN